MKNLIEESSMAILEGVGALIMLILIACFFGYIVSGQQTHQFYQSLWHFLESLTRI